MTSRTTSIIEYGYGRDQVGAVIVNGTELPANNASDRVDVGTLLKMGENTITIRLHSTLYGRTYAEHSGYQDNRVEYGMGKGIMDPPDPDAYYNGLLRVRVVPYKKKEGDTGTGLKSPALYPFASEGGYEMRLRQVINQTMEVDIPQYANMNASTGRKLKKLLAVIAQSVPFKPVMESLATVIGVSRNVLPDYFLYMEQAGMIGQLRDDTGGIRGLGKVEKVYLDNTNLAYLLGHESADIGSIRETFFYNQMRVKTDVISSRISDFEIDGKTFEVGGKKKKQKQIQDAAQGYVVKDDIETGYGNIIPLWQFGLTY